MRLKNTLQAGLLTLALLSPTTAQGLETGTWYIVDYQPVWKLSAPTQTTNSSVKASPTTTHPQATVAPSEGPEVTLEALNPDTWATPASNPPEAAQGLPEELAHTGTEYLAATLALGLMLLGLGVMLLATSRP